MSDKKKILQKTNPKGIFKLGLPKVTDEENT